MRIRGNFDMAVMQTDASAGQSTGRKQADLPSMHVDFGPVGGQTWKIANIVIRSRSFCCGGSIGGSGQSWRKGEGE